MKQLVFIIEILKKRQTNEAFYFKKIIYNFFAEIQIQKVLIRFLMNKENMLKIFSYKLLTVRRNGSKDAAMSFFSSLIQNQIYVQILLFNYVLLSRYATKNRLR